jgi:hypothetical protein
MSSLLQIIRKNPNLNKRFITDIDLQTFQNIISSQHHDRNETIFCLFVYNLSYNQELQSVLEEKCVNYLAYYIIIDDTKNPEIAEYCKVNKFPYIRTYRNGSIFEHQKINNKKDLNTYLEKYN